MRVFLTLLAIFTASSVLAHDHDPANDAWFRSLTNQMGGSCCDGSDAFSVEDPNWERTADPENPFKVFYKNQWLVVHKTSVVKGNNRVGIAKLWPVDQTDESGNSTGLIAVRCFMAGSEI